MCDIDRFKQFNDRYGHECGDFVLVKVAELLKTHTRVSDHVGRWGGEEFLILLPETDAKEGSLIAEKLRAACAEQTHVFHDLELSITLTFGVATHRIGESMEACMTRADIALYEGKSQGRNRVAVG